MFRLMCRYKNSRLTHEANALLYDELTNLHIQVDQN